MSNWKCGDCSMTRLRIEKLDSNLVLILVNERYKVYPGRLGLESQDTQLERVASMWNDVLCA